MSDQEDLENEPVGGANEAQSSQSPEALALVADPAEIWRILGIVNDWIKHAETKAAGTLAASFVSAGVLYNLVKDLTDTSRLLDIVAVLCAVCIAGGAVSASWALRPRLRAKEEPTSGLYFHHIARRHPKPSKGARYLAELHGLTNDREALVVDISSQVWANAHVATDKFRAGNIALTLLLAGILLLGLTATIVAWETW